MKVKELIELLQKMDGEQEVIIGDTEGPFPLKAVGEYEYLPDYITCILSAGGGWVEGD